MAPNDPSSDALDDLLIEVGNSSELGSEPRHHVESAPPGQPPAVDVPEELPVLPLRDSVMFPGTVMPLKAVRDTMRRVLNAAMAGTRRMICAVAQRHGDWDSPTLADLYRVGTACTILRLSRRDEADETMILQGIARVGIVDIVQESPFLVAQTQARPDSVEQSTELEGLVHSVRATAKRAIELSPHVPEEALDTVDGIPTAAGLADFLAANLTLPLENKQELLETFDVEDRLVKVNHAVAHLIEVLEISERIQTQVHQQVDHTQREYFLREQLKAIQEELGVSDTRVGDLQKFERRIAESKMPAPVEEQAQREFERLQGIPSVSPEYANTVDYLDWLCSLPWSISTVDQIDLKRAARILNEDHYGLDRIKKRILEFLAVRKLKPKGRGPILCFTGPPGVGKTSLGQSIARALSRKFCRISLGGAHDESEIRGHRRTYIGALPGRVIQELRKARSSNPVFMLDEVDKLGKDFRGDPAAALLEVLDPEQNFTFTDRYLDVPFDLSSVLFIATANYLEAIPGPLRDRMEVIELSGYTAREKLEIARRYLVPRQIEHNGLDPHALRFDREALNTIITDYTREAGVRELERKIAAICRARAASIVAGETRPRRITAKGISRYLGHRTYETERASKTAIPGVATGLAFTPSGGDILFVEANHMPGTGRLKLTGQIGSVMRESAEAAFSVVKARSEQLGVDPKIWSASDFHIHVPAGATPKDGPSAGLAMLTALTSMLTNRNVDPATGMTGEITLRGTVLPVGGLREKALAAHRAELKRIILPRRNMHDLEELPEDVREQIQWIPIDAIDELIEWLMGAEAGGAPKRKRCAKAPGARTHTPRKAKRRRGKAGKSSSASGSSKRRR